MHHQPAFIAPTQHTDAASAWQQVQTLYAHSVSHLRQAMQDFVAGRDVPDQRIRACYPFVRLHARRAFDHAQATHLSYGFVAEAGRFETTLTRPDLFAEYYQEQFRLLLVVLLSLIHI